MGQNHGGFCIFDGNYQHLIKKRRLIFDNKTIDNGYFKGG